MNQCSCKAIKNLFKFGVTPLEAKQDKGSVS